MTRRGLFQTLAGTAVGNLLVGKILHISGRQPYAWDPWTTIAGVKSITGPIRPSEIMDITTHSTGGTYRTILSLSACCPIIRIQSRP